MLERVFVNDRIWFWWCRLRILGAGLDLKFWSRVVYQEFDVEILVELVGTALLNFYFMDSFCCFNASYSKVSFFFWVDSLLIFCFSFLKLGNWLWGYSWYYFGGIYILWYSILVGFWEFSLVLNSVVGFKWELIPFMSFACWGNLIIILCGACWVSFLGWRWG